MRLLTRILNSIEPLDAAAMASARERLDSLTKPPGSLGRLERIAERVCGMTGKMPAPLGAKAAIVMAGDHGVCEEGVSAFPQAVTEQMVLNFLGGGAAINVFAKHAGAEVVCVDMGVAADVAHPALLVRKVGRGTANMTKGPAMTLEQANEAVFAGVDLVERLAERGVKLMAVGEMGIGNTTSAAALLCALVDGVRPERAVGRGTGIDDAGLKRKRDAVERALAANGLADAGSGAVGGGRAAVDPEYALSALAGVGGFEIAGMVGVCLGAGIFRMPLVLDGYISTVAALVASRMSPHASSYWIASHRSEEPGHGLALEAIGLEPMLELGMRLGEGTGAALCLRIVEAGVDTLASMATFASAGVSGKLEAEG
ncbi:nicotinate-nucleotide--dimethylbenzimidazole phosphoribosyltransferase [Paenibacillus sp. TRM 82003]|nr:nicotinate-nucleotide--dimethylbenzimidazole phosphoribosyltransferase [Paenibacillus sp. TRM 82003]